jgi:hypothetical protein
MKAGKERKLALVLVASRQIKLSSFITAELAPLSLFSAIRLLSLASGKNDPLIYFSPALTLFEATATGTLGDVPG